MNWRERPQNVTIVLQPNFLACTDGVILSQPISSAPMVARRVTLILKTIVPKRRSLQRMGRTMGRAKAVDDLRLCLLLVP
jgi:hypothetical protein